jgi:competence ComEA-like helix-hairpin-helix protein
MTGPRPDVDDGEPVADQVDDTPRSDPARREQIALIVIVAILGAVIILSNSATGRISLQSDPDHRAEPYQLLVNVNTATPDRLMMIPGIGPKLAERIVNERAANGPYKRISDVAKRVHGIGTTLLAEFAPFMTISDRNDADR